MRYMGCKFAENFPDPAARLEELTASNAHFARLAEAYLDVSRTLYLVEIQVCDLDQIAEAALRRQQIRLRHQLHAMLRG